MKRKLITIIAEPHVAQRLCFKIARLLDVQVHVQAPISMRKLVDRLLECEPDVVCYAWSGDDVSVVRWINAQDLPRDSFEFCILSCRGVSMSAASSVERVLAQRGERHESFAA